MILHVRVCWICLSMYACACVFVQWISQVYHSLLTYDNSYSTSVNRTQVELEDMFGDTSGDGDGDNQVYAEIGDQDTTAPSTTQPQDMAAPSAAGSGDTSHQYEDVSNVARTGGGDYQITLCAAYGVAH